MPKISFYKGNTCKDLHYIGIYFEKKKKKGPSESAGPNIDFCVVWIRSQDGG